MSKKPIKITKDKIIGNVELNLIPRNKINKVNITGDVFTKENLISSSKELELYNISYDFDSPYYLYRTKYPDGYFYSGDTFTNDNLPALYSFNYTILDGGVFELAHLTFVKTFNVEFDIDSTSFPFKTTLSDDYYLKFKYNYSTRNNVIGYNSYYDYGSSKDVDDENEILYFNDPTLVGERNEVENSSWVEIKAQEFPQPINDFSYDSGVFIKVLSITKSSSSKFSLQLSIGTNYLKDSVTLTYHLSDYAYYLKKRTILEKFIKNVTVELWGQGYSSQDKNTYSRGNIFIDGSELNIENSFINNKTTKDTSSYSSFIAGKIFDNYSGGRKYGKFTTFYTNFKFVNDTVALSGMDGNLIKVGDLLTFVDYLPDMVFFVTSAEFNAGSGFLDIGFIERIKQYSVICAETAIVSDTLII